jgi:hypothetical protein
VSFKRKIVLLFLGLSIAWVSARWIYSAGYMDADYYFVMGRILAEGKGLSEPFIWNYLDDPIGIPHQAFQYWMPFTSFLAALGQLLFGIGFRSAQIPFILLTASLPLVTSWIAYKLHSDPQLAWQSGLFASLPGFFLPFLVTTDSFSIYGIVGAFVFITLVDAFKNGGFPRWFLAGLLAGITHLTRTDGVLFFLFGIGVVIYSSGDKRIGFSGVIVGYLTAMVPWWVVSGIEGGSILPSGTSRVLWTLNYDELFSYPPEKITFNRWLQSGLGSILIARLEALWMNIKSLLLVNGLVFLGPLMFIGGWVLRHKLIIRLVALYLGLLLLIMSFVFPFAGSRGGYFHSSIAVMPILWALAPLGLQRAIQFGAQRRNWREQQAKDVFITASVVLACLITLGIFWSRVVGEDYFNPVWLSEERVYQGATHWLEREGVDGAVVAINNPPGFYSISRLPSVVIPDGDEEVLRQVVETFSVDWLLLDSNYPQGLGTLYQDPNKVEWLKLKGTLGDVQGNDLFIFRIQVSQP